MNPSDTIRPRLHPDFPGPIGEPKAGVAARFSFRNPDGTRGWHMRELVSAVGEARARAIAGGGK
jgi:hypothetical protein